MKTLGLGRHVLGIGLGLVMLAGCGGSQSQSVGITPQGVARGQQVARKASGSYGDLLYASSPKDRGLIYVFDYPSGSYAGSFYLPNGSLPWGLCADANGNVFIMAFPPNAGNPGLIYEYSHGDTEPTVVLYVKNEDLPLACSRDPASGDLAVSIDDVSGQTHAAIAIFKNASGSPTYYTNSDLADLLSVSYDNSGNLFIVNEGANQTSGLFELPNGSDAFTQIKFEKPIYPFSVQWDGHHLAVGVYTPPGPHARLVIYRLSTSGSQGSISGKSKFDDLGRHQVLSFWIQGNTITLPTTTTKHQPHFTMYRYPSGRNPENEVFGYRVWFLAVSVAPSGSRIRK